MVRAQRQCVVSQSVDAKRSVCRHQCQAQDSQPCSGNKQAQKSNACSSDPGQVHLLSGEPGRNSRVVSDVLSVMHKVGQVRREKNEEKDLKVFWQWWMAHGGVSLYFTSNSKALAREPSMKTRMVYLPFGSPGATDQELKITPRSGETSRSVTEVRPSFETDRVPTGSATPQVVGVAGRVNSSRHLIFALSVRTRMIHP